MLEGIIIKGYSSFYYVRTGDRIYECSLRGKNRLNKIRFLPGDRVLFKPIAEEKGVIEKSLPRKNELIRPPIANVEQVIIVSSLDKPKPDLWLIDRLTILAQWQNLTPVVCFNKIDLVEEKTISYYSEIYIKTGFPIIKTSTKLNKGISELRNILKNKISVFAGLSGVGKSSLLNTIQPGLKLEVGEVSKKLKRGKHTTRHVELIPLKIGGFVADTPGFSSLNLPKDLKREELSFLFPEFEEFLDKCKYPGCLHKEEPVCGVKNAVEKGKINENRYQNYLLFLEEVIKQERSY